jgi:hypothetical protein
VSATEASPAIPPHDMTSGWADLTAVPHSESSWAHSGLVATSKGEVIGFHGGQLVAFDGRGRVDRVMTPGLTEGHGLTLVREGDEEYLWVADPGFIFATTTDDGDEAIAPMFGHGLRQVTNEPRVVKVTLGGEIRAELPIPAMDSSYVPGPMGSYCPCGTAVDEERFGGTGDIWVADGYGSSVVYRFDKAGHVLGTLGGVEGAGRFSCPHAVYIDRRDGKEPEVYIADRGNKRVAVYGLDGLYHRAFGESCMNSPSGFAQWGDLLVVAELYGRLVALGPADDFVGYIGADPDERADHGWPERAGWPNMLTEGGRVGPPLLKPSEGFNSPHSIAVDVDGNLYVSEWLLGGHYTKLALRG